MVVRVEKETFCKRLSMLREAKGVSARDMSLSLGQSPSYINNIENGVNLPSMTVFFYICDYFKITPSEFFDIDTKSPSQLQALLQAAKGLSIEQLSHIIAILQNMQRE